MNDEDFPTLRRISIDPGQGIFIEGARADTCRTNIVWNRRIGKSRVDSRLHRDDIKVASDYNDSFLREIRSLDETVWQTGVWINSHTSHFRYDKKINQLRLAAAVGFETPETLISNDPDRVRQFSKRYSDCIAKPLYPMIWDAEGRNVDVPTAALGRLDEIDDLAISTCPMIYQERVTRRSDLRVVVFGDEIIGVELSPREALRRTADWRPTGRGDIEPRPFAIDEKTSRLIRAYCEAANILHASFDFGVRPDGSLVFFEANLQGQWLWMEMINGEIGLLDAFVRMVAGRHGERHGVHAPVKLEEVMQTLNIPTIGN